MLVALIGTARYAPTPAAAASGAWTGDFYNNKTLSNPKVITVTDPANALLGATPTLDKYWTGSPASGVNADSFSVRWQRTDTWAAGTYRFTVKTDDGMRLYVDNTKILDQWIDQPVTTYFVDFAVSAGPHTLKLEFYDAVNDAVAQLTVQDVNTLPPGWNGQYFSNMTLAGSPTFSRNDGDAIDFQWNTGSPGGGVPADAFSVRWTRSITFNEGVYQFSTNSDDGSRVFVDGQLILNAWQDQALTLTTANKQMTAGAHTVVVEYFEHAGGAEMHFAYEYRPDLGGFVTEPIVTGFATATVFAFAPDGRIFVGQKDGTIRIFKNGALLGTPFYTISPVNNYHDRGLIGLTLDPNFASNHYVYASYTYDPNPIASKIADPKNAQVIRVTANGDVAVPNSKVVLLGTVVGTPSTPSCESLDLAADCIPSDYDSHSIGNLKFGPDGKLYVATGDGASYATVDSRALRAQNIDRLAGKILRVDPATGQGLSDNPFWNGNANATRSKVWAYGVRNDFRFNFKPGTNIIISGEVGWDTWEELNVVTAGENLGWPCYEGVDEQPGYAAFTQCQSLYSAGGVTAPLYQWDHSAGTAAAVGGAFTGTNGYSSAYQNAYFFGDYAVNRISAAKLDASNNIIPGSLLTFTTAADGPVDIEIGPEGDVYYLAINANEIRRIHFVGDNRPPIAAGTASPSAGLTPLTVNFNGTASSDPDAGQAITYDWNFGDGSAHATTATTSHQYNTIGTYTAVTDRHRSVLPHRYEDVPDPGRQHAAERHDHVPGERRPLRYRRHDLLLRHRERCAGRQHPAVEHGLERHPQPLLRRHVHDLSHAPASHHDRHRRFVLGR